MDAEKHPDADAFLAKYDGQPPSVAQVKALQVRWQDNTAAL